MNTVNTQAVSVCTEYMIKTLHLRSEINQEISDLFDNQISIYHIKKKSRGISAIERTL